MPDDASNDWLDVAKTRAQGIRTALGAIVIFVASILVTISSQVRQFHVEQKAETTSACFAWDLDPGFSVATLGRGQVPASQPRSPACPEGADWITLKASYDYFAADEEKISETTEAELTPWYDFVMESTIIGSFVEGTDPSKLTGPDSEVKLVKMLAEASSETPVKPGTTKEISAFFLDLKTYDSNIRTVIAAASAKTRFEDLDRDQIVALANSYAFTLNNQDLQGEQGAKALANPKFTSRLNQLRSTTLNRNQQGQPIMEERFVETLKKGESLDLFTTLRQQLIVIDLEKFQGPEETEMKKFLDFLASTPFTSIGAEHNEYALQKKKTDAILRGEVDSAVNLPLLNISVNLSDFAYLSGFLNLAFLGWIYWQARQINYASIRYMNFTDADKSHIEAVLQGLPGSGSWDILSRAGFAFLLTLPTLLGTLFLFEPLLLTRLKGLPLSSLLYLAFRLTLYLTLPAVVFILAFAFDRFIEEIPSRAFAGRREPPTQATGTTLSP